VSLENTDCVTLLYYQLSCCSPLLHSSAISISHSSIWERRVVKRLSFSRDLDADTHTMMQINRKLMRSTSTTGPTITGMMRARFNGCGASWYVSVPTVKFQFVPKNTWRNEKTVQLSLDESTACKTVLVLTVTAASDTPPGGWVGGEQTIYKEQVSLCQSQNNKTLTQLHGLTVVGVTLMMVQVSPPT